MPFGRNGNVHLQARIRLRKNQFQVVSSSNYFIVQVVVTRFYNVLHLFKRYHSAKLSLKYSREPYKFRPRQLFASDRSKTDPTLSVRMRQCCCFSYGNLSWRSRSLHLLYQPGLFNTSPLIHRHSLQRNA